MFFGHRPINRLQILLSVQAALSTRWGVRTNWVSFFRPFPIISFFTDNYGRSLRRVSERSGLDPYRASRTRSHVLSGVGRRRSLSPQISATDTFGEDLRRIKGIDHRFIPGKAWAAGPDPDWDERKRHCSVPLSGTVCATTTANPPAISEG